MRDRREARAAKLVAGDVPEHRRAASAPVGPALEWWRREEEQKQRLASGSDFFYHLLRLVAFFALLRAATKDAAAPFVNRMISPRPGRMTADSLERKFQAAAAPSPTTYP